MEIIINDNDQSAELWIPRNTPPNAIDNIRKQYISSGYTVISYYSGSQDLADLTAKLLEFNK